jgi:hypothetical protein
MMKAKRQKTNITAHNDSTLLIAHDKWMLMIDHDLSSSLKPLVSEWSTVTVFGLSACPPILQKGDER